VIHSLTKYIAGNGTSLEAYYWWRKFWLEQWEVPEFTEPQQVIMG
jgi:O-acetylhomoserine/O-acetylserine sulfhydrylase-like pyridoxal-dependent enzyme